MNRHANARQCWTICCRWPGFEPAKPVPRGRWKNDQHKKVHCSSPRPSSRQAQSPVNLDPSAGKSHHRLRHRHNKQAALLAASGGMRAPGRGQAAWQSILDSLQLSLFSGEISPPPQKWWSLGANSPCLTVFSTRGEPRPDTKRAVIMAQRWQRDHVHAMTLVRETADPRAHRILPSGSKYQQIAQISLAMPTSRQQQTNALVGTLPSKCPALHRCWLFDPGRGKFRVTCDSNPSHPSPAPDDWMPSHVHPSLTTP